VARQYFGLDLATELDPAFMNLYTLGANFLAVARNDKESALKLIQKADLYRKQALIHESEEFRKSYWPDDWHVALIKGYLYLFEFHDPIKAAEAYKELDLDERVPPLLRRLGQHLSTNEGIREVGTRVLTKMIEKTEDPALKEKLTRKIEELRKL
jgi:hypothetical protein